MKAAAIPTRLAQRLNWLFPCAELTESESQVGELMAGKQHSELRIMLPAIGRPCRSPGTSGDR